MLLSCVASLSAANDNCLSCETGTFSACSPETQTSRVRGEHRESVAIVSRPLDEPGLSMSDRTAPVSRDSIWPPDCGATETAGCGFRRSGLRSALLTPTSSNTGLLLPSLCLTGEMGRNGSFVRQPQPIISVWPFTLSVGRRRRYR